MLLAHGAAGGGGAAATHGLAVGSASDRLAAAPIRRQLVTDNLTPVERSGLPAEVQSVAGLLAGAIGRLHRNEDLADLLAWA